MTNKEKIDYLLIDLRELENLIASMKEVDFYPASFFNQTFQLTHKVFTELHSLENLQIETLRKQMEEHQRLIDSIQQTQPVQTPEIKEEKTEPSVSVETREPEERIVNVASTVASHPEKPQQRVETLSAPITRLEVPTQPMVQEVKETISTSMSEPHTKTVLADKSSVSLNDVLEKQNLSDFKKAFSLNDRFRFRRELFGGNEEKMNQAITDLNSMSSYEESVEYLNNVLKWNVEDESVADFMKLLEKRFS